MPDTGGRSSKGAEHESPCPVCRLVSSAFFGTITAANASWHYDMTYRDLLRPNGQPRGDGAYQATWLSAAGKRM